MTSRFYSEIQGHGTANKQLFTLDLKKMILKISSAVKAFINSFVQVGSPNFDQVDGFHQSLGTQILQNNCCLSFRINNGFK